MPNDHKKMPILGVGWGRESKVRQCFRNEILKGPLLEK